MLTPDKSYPDDLDYEWFAVDAKEQIARFTTGGLGPLPKVVFENLELSDSLMSFVHGLPLRGGSSMLVTLPYPDDFLKSAGQGFFSYDWSDVHRVAKECTGVYELLSRPEKPIFLADFPEAFHSTLRKCSLASLHFDSCESIDTGSLLPSIIPSPE